MPTTSFTALPLATLTLTLTARPAPPPAGPSSDRGDRGSGGQEAGRDDSVSGEAG